MSKEPAAGELATTQGTGQKRGGEREREMCHALMQIPCLVPQNYGLA